MTNQPDTKSRSSSEIRKNGNRLRGAGSLYLRQHQYNPVDWHPWCPESRAIALAEDKPIFLSIGYAACHWCHVMEREVFDDNHIADFLNNHFICIKVDREEHPDVDQIYMRFVQGLTGSGGWPLNVFLTPDLKPFFGATTYPAELFLNLIQKLVDIFQSKRNMIEQQAQSIAEQLIKESSWIPGPIVDQTSIIQSAGSFLSLVDPIWGGLEGRMKFPMPSFWRFMLHVYRKTADPKMAKMIRLTLDNMGSGGIHDHIEGGFHRYTVEPTWLIPHFEKMLYDQALLSSLYLEASAVFNHSRYREIASDTLDFVTHHMTNPHGGFATSLDADSEGQEGSYYLWSPRDLQQALGSEIGKKLAHFLRVTEEGNFEGKNILTLRPLDRIIHDSAPTLQDVQALFRAHKPSLQTYRDRRPRPTLDTKVITSLNGLMIDALARGASILGRHDWLQAARKAADFLLDHHLEKNGSLARASNQAEIQSGGILDDYAYLIQGILTLFEASGEISYLEHAMALTDYVMEEFDRREGGFYYTSRTHPAFLGRQIDITDNVTPSANAVMLHVLHIVYILTSNRRYREKLETSLRAFSQPMSYQSIDMVWWQDAALMYAGPFYQVVVAGNPRSTKHRQLTDTLRAYTAPFVFLLEEPPTGFTHRHDALLPAIRNERKTTTQATAYVCQPGTCMAPTQQPEELHKQLHSDWNF